jgi:CysZ protein
VVLLLGGAWHLASSLAHRWTGGHGLLGAALFALIMAAVVAALGYVGFVVLLSLACAPFCSALSDRVEAIAAGRPPPKRTVGETLVEALRGVAHAIGRLALYVVVSVPLYLLGVAVPPASPIFVGLGMVVTSYFLAYDFLDYPLSSRARGFGAKWRYVMGHQPEALGFGGMVGLLLAVPALNVLVAPFAAVGAALLFVDLERADAP